MFPLNYIYFYSYIFIQVIFIEADGNHYRLMKQLFAHYDKNVRPVRNASNTLDVTIDLGLNQVMELNEKSQILISNCWMHQKWTDQYLTWNESDYGGITVINVPSEKIWLPDLILNNNADPMYKHAIFSSNAVLEATGDIYFLASAVLKSTCDINIAYFPFDEQTCIMKFSTWTYDYTQVNLTILNENGDLSNYVPSSEWDLVEMRAERELNIYKCCPQPYSDIFFIIVLRRRALFYVFNLILPCTFITLVALLTFYVPSESGEKITLGITTMLSMTVFLMFVSEKMPPSADQLPLIELYYGVMIFLVTLATALSVVTLAIHHKGENGQEVPEKIKRFVFGFLSKFTLITHRNASVSISNKKETNTEGANEISCDNVRRHFFSNDQLSSKFVSIFNEIPNQNNIESLERQLKQCFAKIFQIIDENNKRIEEQDRKDTIRMEWQQVARIVDRVLLVVFLLATFSATTIILFWSPYGNPFTM